MHSIVKFLIVLLHSLLLCFCTVLLCEVNTIQIAMHKFVGVLDNPLVFSHVCSIEGCFNFLELRPYLHESHVTRMLKPLKAQTAYILL